MANHRRVCKKWFLVVIQGKLLSVFQLARKVIYVTSNNSDDYKIIQISTILVSSVEITTKVKNSQWKRKLQRIEHR